MTPSSEYFDGKISNVQIFNTVLSGSEVETLYNYGSPIQTLANIPQSSNLKAWYKLDATEIYNSTSTEWSVDNNQNPSAYPSSLDFNSASSAYINLGQPSNFTNIGSSDFTQSCWIYQNSFTSGTDWHGLIYIGARGSSQGHLFVKNNSGTPVIGCGIGDGATNSYGPSNETTYVVNNGQWYHIAYVKNSTSLKIYVNGNFVQSFSSTISPDPLNEDAYIGRGATVGYDEFFDGSISNASVWDAALTPAQVTEIYNNGTPSNLSSHSATSNLVSWWKLNNTTTGIEDSKGSNNGSNNGATEYAGFVNTLAGESSGMSQSNLTQSDLQTVAPYSKYAMSFDGTGDYIDTNFRLGSGTACSLSGWFYITNYTSYGGLIVDSTGSGNQTRFTLSQGSGTAGNLAIYVGSGAGNWNNETISLPSVGQWFHLCGTISGTTVKIYINNYLVNTFTSTLSYIGNNQHNYFIGGPWSANDLNGIASNVSIWNYELNSSQVREIYNEGLSGNLHNFSGAAPAAWWQLGENSSYVGGWTFADEIGTSNATGIGLPEIALTNGVGTTANGTSTGMSEGSLVGDAPYSTANAISSGMAVTAKGTNVP